MTVVAVCSVGGAPGCTTLACLLAAVWPVERAAVVAECDPAGGTLAAWFQLNPRVGTTSFVLAARHAASPQELEPHLQHLPGGLEVLAGPAGTDAARIVDHEVQGLLGIAEVGRDVVVDLGRLDPCAPGQQALLGRSDATVLVVADDRAAASRAEASAGHLRATAGGRTGLAVASARGGRAREVAVTVGLPVAAVVPRDDGAAAIVRGDHGPRRRLSRSPLVRAAVALQDWVLAAEMHPVPGTSPAPAGPAASSKGAGATRDQ